MNDSTDTWITATGLSATQMIPDDPVARRMLHALVIDDTGEPSPDPPGVGTRTPEVWLVADRLPAKARSTVPLHTAAGRALVWPLVDPERHRVSNASLHRQDPRDLFDRWQALGRPATIALGQAAAVALTNATRQTSRSTTDGDLLINWHVPLHGRLAHPQFVWRFHRSGAEEYRMGLRALLDAVHAAPPRIERTVEESAEVRALRVRLAAAPDKFLVAASGLDRAEAHNLTRRLRRAGGLRVLMRQLKTGAYAVLARAESTQEETPK